MSRHGYVDDLGHRDLAMWRGRVASAIRGKRGQRMLVELRDSLDAMRNKRLVSRVLQRTDGDFCAIGCLAASRGADFTEYEEADELELYDLNGELAALFDVAECLIQEIEYENDEGGKYDQTPEERWQRMRRWVEQNIRESTNEESKCPTHKMP